MNWKGLFLIGLGVVNMKQKLITGRNLEKWESFVNGYLERGWKIIPTTLQVSAIDNSGTYMDGCYAVALQKDTE